MANKSTAAISFPAEGNCHGKIILLGEHSVVYGHGALAHPVKSLSLTTGIESGSENSGGLVQTEDYRGPWQDLPSAYGGIKSIIAALLSEYGKAADFIMSFRSNIPMERGLGSSAAVSVATVTALAKYLGLPLTDGKLVALANAAETINHGSASGLDVATVLSDCTLFFRKGQVPVKIPNALGAYLVIADTGIRGNTRQAVTAVRAKYETDAAARALIARLGTIATAGLNAWQVRDALSFGQLMNESQACLAALGVSLPIIGQLATAARKAGALGAKLSGGGLGGVVIALAGEAQAALAISQAMVTAGAKGTWVDAI